MRHSATSPERREGSPTRLRGARVLAAPLIAALLLSVPVRAHAQASVVQVDHTCGRGTGHVITYHVKATGNQPVHAVYFPRPRFQRGVRPVLSTSGFACCETCCMQWTYAEAVVKGRQVSCFTTMTTPIQPGETRTFTIVATLDQPVDADGKMWKLEGGGLTQGNPWFYSTDPDPEATPKTGSNPVAGVNGSGPPLSPTAAGGEGSLHTDTEGPDHMICSPSEFSGTLAGCSSITYYVTDDQDPSPQVVCEELTPYTVRLTATDAAGNSAAGVYDFSPQNPTAVPLSREGMLVLMICVGITGAIAIRRSV